MSNTMTLRQILEILHENVELSTTEEVAQACKLIIQAQELDAGERDCLRAAYRRGPLYDGDVPSKSGRDRLVAKKLMVKIVMQGREGYNACTYRGARVFRLLEAGAA